MSFDLVINFTPESVQREPRLKGWRSSFSAQLQSTAAMILAGDFLSLQGVPTDKVLRVLFRQWEVMEDVATLTLVLEVCEEP